MACSVKTLIGNGGVSFSNGTEWTQSNITNIGFQCVYYVNNLWVTGSSYKGLYYSINGKTWVQSNITSDYFECVYNANNIWVAGSGNKGLYYSITWELSTN